ncbi:unnamed protein product [Closterium sp. NIES-54]
MVRWVWTAPRLTFSRVDLGDAGTVDTLETWLADARRRHEADEYGKTLPLEVVELGIRAQWATDHPSFPASPRPVRNEGGFPPDKVSVTPPLDGRHDLLTWKESIEPQLEMSGLMCFADGTVEKPHPSNAELRAEFRTVQLLTFTVISRCSSLVVQIALKSCRSQLDAGHRAWQFIMPTYQVTDDLYIGQLEKQMGKQETTADYCNQARRLLACMRMVGVEYSTASYITHVFKGLPSGYNLMKRLMAVPGTRESLNEDSLTSYIFRDEAMHELNGGGGSGGGKPAKDADKAKLAKDGGRGGGNWRQEYWLCGVPNHLSFECPDHTDSDDDDSKGG